MRKVNFMLLYEYFNKRNLKHDPYSRQFGEKTSFAHQQVFKSWPQVKLHVEKSLIKVLKGDNITLLNPFSHLKSVIQPLFQPFFYF